MANHRTDLTGLKIGVLTVLRPAPTVKGETFWHCQCGCGFQDIKATTNLRIKHGGYEICYHDPRRKKLHRIHQNMITRCFYQCSMSYKNYGGRGITVCDRWRIFRNFYDDVADLFIDGFQMDRINNEGNYEPGNIRWVSSKDNKRNTRQCKLTMELANIIRGDQDNARLVALKYDIHPSTVRRIKKGILWA